ncbi:hypothetical protein BT69DRAFT_1379006 [Atractiella rhizophila]|nr:hypothetical protein BT69DRAFT_1379006 [Atractiella rhizophila]
MYRSDVQQRPMSNVDYQDLNWERSFANTPKQANFAQGPSNFSYGQGFSPPNKKGGFLGKKWVRWIPPVIPIIVGAVLGGVLGTRDSGGSHKSSSIGSNGSNGGSSSGSPGSGTTSSGLGSGSRNNFVPVVSFLVLFGFTPTTSTLPPSVRPDHPRLIADSARWECVKELIASDAYLAGWNETIIANATKFANMDPVPYDIDGGLGDSGVLDVARQVQVRIKHWGWAYRMTGDTKWAERTWQEILVASGNDSSVPFGTAPDNWNTQHWLDVGEFILAFAIAYDWFYDYWSAQQKTDIMWSIITLGLDKALNVYDGSDTNHSWWYNPGVNGNWNCVCNGGVIAGALAISGDDPTGASQTVLQNSIPNAANNCAFGVSTDGTWSETAAYWYFGTSTMVEMASNLETATGSVQGLWDLNPFINLTGLFHIYGDTGPNKYTATANTLMYMGRYFDADEPFSALWYDATATGAWPCDLPLDHYFPHENHTWVSTRSSWTDTDGFYIATKGHGDLDAGDFVMEAIGQRWFGELGSGNYLADDYFRGEGQNSNRWLYYRKRTEGQNTIAQYTSTSGSEVKLDAALPSTSTAWYWMDLSSYYSGATVRRGFRYINGRKQAIIRDEIQNANGTIQWRAHTNATMSFSDDKKTATLELGGKKMTVQIQTADGIFSQLPATRYSTDPALPSGDKNQDQPNDPTTVLCIELPAGSATIQVLFNPQWDGMDASAFVTPSSTINLADWSNTSHN